MEGRASRLRSQLAGEAEGGSVMGELSDEEKERQTRRFADGFVEGFVAARLGLPAENVLETDAGAIEGRRTEDGMAFDLPDGSTFESWTGSDGVTTFTRDGRAVCRLHPVTVEPDEDDDAEDAD